MSNDNRNSLFSVIDVDPAIVLFGHLLLIYLLVITGYALFAEIGRLKTLFLIWQNTPTAIQTSVGIIFLKEAIEIMFFKERYIQQGRDEGKAEAAAEAKQAITERDKAINERDKAIAERDKAIAERDQSQLK